MRFGCFMPADGVCLPILVCWNVVRNETGAFEPI